MYNPGQEISTLDFGAIIGGSLNAVVAAQSQSANTTVDFIRSVGFTKEEIKDSENNVIGEKDVPINVAFTYDKEVMPARMVNKQTWEITFNNTDIDDTDVANYKLKVADKSYDVKSVTKKEKGITVTVELDGETTDAELKESKVVYTKEGNETEVNVDNALMKDEKNEYAEAVVQKMQIEVPILTMMPIPFIKIEYADIDFNVKINSVSKSDSESITNSKVDTNVRNSFFVKASLNASVSNQKKTTSSEEVKKDYSLNIKVHAVQDDMPAGVSRILDMLEESITNRPLAVANS